MTYDNEAIADLLEQVEGEGNPRMVDLADGLKAVKDLPEAWAALCGASSDQRRVVAALWEGLADKLPRTLKMLERKLVGFAFLLTDSAQPSLLYLFDEGRDLMALRGFWPTEALPQISKDLSVDLSPMYRLHDGWVNIFGAEGGPLPSAQWRTRGAAPKVRGFLEVYSNGSHALGFDLDDRPAKAFSMDTDDDEVEAVDDFWIDLDERLAASLKSFPDAN